MKLTPKENYLMLGRGEMPEYVPFYTMMGTEYMGEAPVKSLSPMVFKQDHFRDGGYDMWGVRYVADANTGATLPEPNHFLLEDINDWEKVLKFPDRNDDFDYEMMYKKDLEERKIDRNQSATIAMAGLMPFQQLVAFMGFTEGLCALFEEPEECQALFEYLGDFYCEVCEKSIDYYKPDVLGIVDDTAAWGNPFVSLDMFREFLVPQYKRLAQFAHDRDLVITYHNCGKCESFIDDMVNVVGINEWNPAQNCNDLAAIKAKYGNKLTLCGCINSSQTFIGEMTDEHIREIVWDVANKYAPGGGFQFMEVSHEFYKK